MSSPQLMHQQQTHVGVGIHMQPPPHRRDFIQCFDVFRGRPLWFALLQSQTFQSFVQSRWLDMMFPVVVAASATDANAPIYLTEGSRRNEQQQNAPFPPGALHVLGASAAPTTSQATFPLSPSMNASGVTRDRVPIVSSSATQDIDYARAPSDASAAREERFSGAHTIPTAMATMNGKRERLLQEFRRWLTTSDSGVDKSGTGNTRSHRKKDTTSGKGSGGVGASPSSLAILHGTSIGSSIVTTASSSSSSSNPAMTRVSSIQLLREEISRSRISGSQMTYVAPMQEPRPDASTTNQSNGNSHENNNATASIFETPLQTRYSMWLATSRGRTMLERYVEVSMAVARAMRSDPAARGGGSGPSQVIKSLITEALVHPVEAHRSAIEKEILSEDMALSGLNISDPSSIAWLELRVFGYLPSSTPAASSSSTDSGGPSKSQGVPPTILTAPHALFKSALSLSKANSEGSITMELLLRHRGIRELLSMWWQWLPKHMQQQQQQQQHGDRTAATGINKSLISRATVDHIACLVHTALLGGSLPLASTQCLQKLKQLSHDDWLGLFVSPVAVPAASATALVSRLGAAGEGGRPVSDSFRSIIARGAESPMCVDFELFSVALLQLLEPWMETVLPEERELALMMLFHRCFHRAGGAGGDADAAANTFSLKPLVATDSPAALDPSRSRSPSQRPLSSSMRRAQSAGPASTKRNPLTELVEQFDAATDPKLLHALDQRNRNLSSDIGMQHHQHQWEHEVFKSRVQLETQTPYVVCGDPQKTTQPIKLRKTFVPHDPASSFGLERVLLQRLTKRLARASAPIPPTSATSIDDENVKDITTAVEQANLVVHAAKQLIPAEYLHHIARYHRHVVEDFRASVAASTVVVATSTEKGRIGGAPRAQHPHQEEHVSDDDDNKHFVQTLEALTSPSLQLFDRVAQRRPSTASPGRRSSARSSRGGSPSPPSMDERGGDDNVATSQSADPSTAPQQQVEEPFQAEPADDVSSVPPQLLDVKTLASILTPPSIPGYRQPKKTVTSTAMSRLFVRRPHSATMERSRSPSGQDGDDAAPRPAERPISAVHARRIGEPRVVARQKPNTQPQAARRPSSAMQQQNQRLAMVQRVPTGSSTVLYVSPFMHRGALPVSNGEAYCSQLSGAAVSGGGGGQQHSKRPSSALR